jgi:hypothetical protein
MPQFAKLHETKFALAAGILAALCTFIITVLGIYSGYCSQCTSLLTGIYGSFAYSVSWFGALIGMVYGFVDTFIAVWIFAWLYNKFLG